MSNDCDESSPGCLGLSNGNLGLWEVAMREVGGAGGGSAGVDKESVSIECFRGVLSFESVANQPKFWFWYLPVLVVHWIDLDLETNKKF